MGVNIQNAILRVLSYFHVFRYPLTKEEICKYLPVKCGQFVFNENLNQLVQTKVVFCIDRYYSLENDASLIERRIVGTAYAKTRLKKAHRIARFLGNFPFVNSVCISGSLSKDFALPDSDLDFFIITESDRLWIARTLMHLFKKLTFLVGAQHSFCMNYYVSMQHAEIDQKNIFTATELVTLKPAFNGSGIRLLSDQNCWTKVFLPNAKFDMSPNENRKWFLSRLSEKIIDKIGGDKLELALYEFTCSKWEKKWVRQKLNVEKCRESVRYHYCKPIGFPKNYPDKIVAALESIYKQYSSRVKVETLTTQTH